MIPKVFVSHASEDQERFVLTFAERLRQNGVDAWLDKWEMLPGDSLIDKIFEEGIKEAKAVIVVLSKFSVSKPWVKEELNAACVKRINSGSKLIPVVIDDCDIPEVLKSTLWERVSDLSAYDSSFDRILASIFGTTDKPSIGSAPQYVRSFVSSINGLNNIDSHVLRLSCEEIMRSGGIFVNPEKVFFNDGRSTVPMEELKDSLEVLDGEGYIKLLRTLCDDIYHYQITTYGFESFANECILNYQDKVLAVVSALVNEKLIDSADIQKKVSEPCVLVDHILEVLNNNGHIKQSKLLGGSSQVYNISPSLKRMLSSQVVWS
ncbi:toll/interleukin-1 receptor domain-containing protein [Thiothrix sp.]|jgi:hypothetical protein|uniref:toll/interleukin-1 receptor domain-containing protein n=1 Tax=Thiothrix sp. TaxID=1032 RepID=UPI00257DB204|nr:toll/interleukin-1 receptor domain-containing protein [Thiothrix sp.]